MAETNLEKLERERKEAAAKKLQDEKQDLVMFSYDKLAVENAMSKEMVVILHKQIAKNTSLSEFAYFIKYCKALELNPVLKEVWCYKDHKDNLIIFAGKDGFVKKAKEDPYYLGFTSAFVCENDPVFILDIPNCFVDHQQDNKPRGKCVGAYCWVKSKDKTQRADVLVWVPFDEFNKNQSTWSVVPSEMIKKVAECHALKQFVGIPGLQNEYEFKVGTDDLVTHIAESPVEKKQEVKEDERLSKLIENTTDLAALRKLAGHCQTPEMVELFDNKKKELQGEQSGD